MQPFEGDLLLELRWQPAISKLGARAAASERRDRAPLENFRLASRRGLLRLATRMTMINEQRPTDRPLVSGPRPRVVGCCRIQLDENINYVTCSAH